MSPEEASPNTPDDVFNDGALSVEVDTTGPHTCIDVDGIHKPDCNAAELQPAYDPDTAICANVVAQVVTVIFQIDTFLLINEVKFENKV